MTFPEEEDGVNYDDREILVSRTVLRHAEWRLNSWGDSHNEDPPCIADTCFNGGDLCSFNWMRRHGSYLRRIYPHIPKLEQAVEKRTEFVLGNHGREIQIVL